MERADIKSSRVKLFLLSFASAAGVALGVFLTVVVAADDGDDSLRALVVGAALIIYCGLRLVSFIARLFRRR